MPCIVHEPRQSARLSSTSRVQATAEMRRDEGEEDEEHPAAWRRPRYNPVTARVRPPKRLHPPPPRDRHRHESAAGGGCARRHHSSSPSRVNSPLLLTRSQRRPGERPPLMPPRFIPQDAINRRRRRAPSSPESISQRLAPFFSPRALREADTLGLALRRRGGVGISCLLKCDRTVSEVSVWWMFWALPAGTVPPPERRRLSRLQSARQLG